MYFFLIFFISLNLFKVNHPILLASMLVLTAFFSSLMLGKMLISWLFYLLALVFLGGVMVVLLFMVSVCANEKFFYSNNFSILLLFLVYLFMVFLIQPFIGVEMSFNSFNLAILLYEKDSALSFISFMMVLMLCLISVVMVSKMESGPLVKRL